MTVYFHGNQQESAELSDAIGRNCACEFDSQNGVRTKTCAPHAALVNDQQFVDDLLFYRRIRERLQREEQSRGT